jgi:hypothetical protein
VALPRGTQVKVTDLDIVDDAYGVLVNLRSGNDGGVVPLYDLEVINESSYNFQHVDDCNTWFSNRSIEHLG